MSSAEAADPTSASARTSHAGKIVCKRRLAAIARSRAALTGAGNCSVAAVRTDLNVACGGGDHNSATVTTTASTSPGKPARFKSSSAASAQAEPSYAMSAFILAAIITPFFSVIYHVVSKQYAGQIGAELEYHRAN
jgi:hypothetical protein